MTLDSLAIATEGYVCGNGPDPISIATHGYVCIGGQIVDLFPLGGGADASDTQSMLAQEDEMMLKIIRFVLERI